MVRSLPSATKLPFVSLPSTEDMRTAIFLSSVHIYAHTGAKPSHRLLIFVLPLSLSWYHRSSQQQTARDMSAALCREEHSSSEEAAPRRQPHSADTWGSHLQNTWNGASWFNGISHHSCTDRNNCSKCKWEKSPARQLTVLDVCLLYTMTLAFPDVSPTFDLISVAFSQLILSSQNQRERRIQGRVCDYFLF